MTFVTFLFFIITTFIVTHQSTCGQISASELSSALQPTPYVISTLPPLPTVTPSQISIPTPAPTPTLSPLPTPTQSPGQKGKIYGYVVDIAGEPIVFVKLRLKGIKTGYNSPTSSDIDGFFEFEELEADTYVLIAKKRRYKTAKQAITLAEGDETEVEIEMRATKARGPPSIVKGVVFDNENGNPIKGAKITVRGTSGSYTTGSEGKFLFELDAGKYTLRTEATGYQTKNTKIKLREHQTLTKNIGLKKSRRLDNRIEPIGTMALFGAPCFTQHTKLSNGSASMVHTNSDGQTTSMGKTSVSQVQISISQVQISISMITCSWLPSSSISKLVKCVMSHFLPSHF